MKKLGFTFLITLLVSGPVLPYPISSIERSPIETVITLPVAGCFDSDPDMGVLDRNAHLQWARQNVRAIGPNLVTKIGYLFACASVKDATLRNAFVDVSVLIANYVSDARCFGGNADVVSKDSSVHERWARTKSRAEVGKDLQWKTGAAANCIDPKYLPNFFADVSVVVANAGARGR